METDITSIILFITFLVLFGVFLCFDLLERNEKYGYFAYIMVLVPVNYLWYLTTVPESIFYGVDSLTVFLVLFILIDICLARDFLFVYRETKDFDDIILFLILGLIIQVIITGILPNSVGALKTDTMQVGFFYVPNVHDPTFPLGLQIAFQLVATIMVLLAIAPMILDIKDEEISLPVIVLITVIFFLPFLYLGFIWADIEAMWVTAVLLCVVLFIFLLFITKK
ncbi:MAG: hypothetical protein JW891_02910 [Candidatus Lokiarchaeota archaeon]|nr:hypothetical protein [Candidatus Lokiarchaeota archaeon]